MSDTKLSLGLAILPLSSLVLQASPSAAAPSPALPDAQGNLFSLPDSSELSQPAFTPVPDSQVPPQFTAPTFTAQVVPAPDGTGTDVSREGQQFNITGGTQVQQNLFHRFRQLDLQEGQVANFLTQPSTQAIFSQVSGDTASYLDGLLQVSGSSADLFVINPAGIVFGPNAQLNIAGSFTATTSDWLGFEGEQWLNVVAGQNYGELQGETTSYGFSTADPGSVVNQGNLAVRVGQAIRLLGGNIVNQGELVAPGGEVSAIATSGESIVRIRDRSQLLTVEITPTTGTDVASTSNPIAPPSLPELLAGAPQTPEAQGIQVDASGTVSLVAGDLSTAHRGGEAGGQVNLIGETVQVVDSVVDASGQNGGTIRVGGDYQGRDSLPASTQTQIDATSVLRADGIASAEGPVPEGGTVVVWSDGATEFAGTASARGGGLVETSGQQQLAIAPTAKVETATETGEPGQWLLDPADLTVIPAGGAATITGGTNAPVGASTIDRPTLEAALNGNNVQLQATNSIQVDTPIDTTGNANPGDLQLDAPTIDLNQSIQLNGNLSGTANTANVGTNGSIQNGVDVVVAAGTVNLAAATYREGQEIVIDQQVRLQGQGAGSTIISGDADGDDGVTADFSDNHRIVRLTPTADGTAIAGTTFSGGDSATFGGAIFNEATEVVIEDSLFENNQTSGGISADGAAIHTQGQITINNTRFENNLASGGGGAIDLEAGSVTLNNATFVNNQAQQWHGGAIDVDSNGTLTVINSSFDNNVADTGGGAIYVDGRVNIRDSEFLNNQSRLDGGAIALRNSARVQINNTDFVQNTTDFAGGAIANDSTVANSLTVTSSTFDNNQAQTGGAVELSLSGGSASFDDVSFINNDATVHAGGLYVSTQSNATLTNSRVTDNTAGAEGGGIRLFNDASISISNTDFLNNEANFGGALELSDTSTAQVLNSLFQGNVANNRGGAIGLGLSSSVVIRDTSINLNEAVDRGGGISSNGDLSLENVFAFGNRAQSGGGLALQGTGTTQILTSTISSNEASTGGGIQQTGSQNLRIDGSTLINNSASNNGAALDLNPSVVGITTEVQNSTISGNSAANLGGGISLGSVPVVELNNVTVANNQATVGGGLSNPFGGSLTLRNTIAAGNVASTNPDVNGPITSGGNNLVQNRGSSSGYITSDLANGTDPLLVSLADNGGPTLTHAIRVGSPAVNAGSGAALPTDQRGAAANGVRDIGAYELRDNRLSLLPSNAIQSTTVNQAFPNPISLTVSDLLGGAITGLTVTATPAATGASATIVPAAPLVTNDNGVVSAIATANTVAGTHSLILGAGSNTIPFTLTNLPDAPSSLTLLNGDNQSTVVNTAFVNPLQLALTDQFGNAIPGATVTLSPAGSGSSATPGNLTLTTDAAGQASTTLTANTVAGSHSLGIAAGALTNSASLTNLPDAPSVLDVLSGDGQSSAVNTSFANPLQVELTDQFGNAIPGATVTLTPAGSGSSATPANLTLTTDAAGQASTTLTANTIAGSHSLGLSAGALTNSASLINLPDTPSDLNILNGDGQTTLIDTAFASDLIVQVVDQYGNAVPGATVTFVPPANGATSTLRTPTAITNAAGQAQTSASANGIEGNYQVAATTGSLSRNLSLTNTTPPTPPEPPTPPISPTPTPEPEPEPPIPPISPTPTPEPEPPIPPIPPTPPVTSTPVNPPPTAPTSAPTTPSLLTLLSSQSPQFSDDFLRETEEESLVSQREPRPLEQTVPGTVTLFNEAAFEEIDQSFSEEYAKYWELKQPEGKTIQEARTLLKRAEEVYQAQSGILYAFFVSPNEDQNSAMDLTRRHSEEANGSDRLLLTLIPSTGDPIYELVDVTRDELLRQSKLFRLAVSDPEDELSYRPLAQQMHQWLLAPLEDDIQRLQLDNLLYVLDSGLRTIPLSAMMDGDEFLIERYGLSIIPSVDLLQANFDSPTPNPQTLAAGANEFEELNDLPAVTVELDVIANSQQSTEILFNQAFTPENLLKAQADKQPEILHLATHAEFNAGDVASSYLQFWEEQLTLDQISQLGWEELELLILSACATAISSPEAELGFAGIAAATGVETSLGSLWNVSDIGTLALMAEFYGQLSQDPLRFEALRHAQVEMLQGRTKIQSQSLATERGNVELPAEWDLPETADFSHPFYWSGFTLVGNPWW